MEEAKFDSNLHEKCMTRHANLQPPVKGSCKQWQLAEWRIITWNPVSLLVGPSINKRVELPEPHTTPLSSLPPSVRPWIASSETKQQAAAAATASCWLFGFAYSLLSIFLQS